MSLMIVCHYILCTLLNSTLNVIYLANEKCILKLRHRTISRISKIHCINIKVIAIIYVIGKWSTAC